MGEKKIEPVGRRHFIFSTAGILGGMIIPGTGKAKQTVNAILGELDVAALQQAKPERDPSVEWREEKTLLRLYRKGAEGHHHLCDLNRTGETVWFACDGDRNLRDITRILQETYRVSHRQAYLDCLCFLVELKNRGAIRI
jgi:hypothetical protein